MIRASLMSAAVLLALGVPAMAQDAGGLPLAPGLNGGPHGLARALPFVRPPLLTARDVQNGLLPADRQAVDQGMITRLRGDPGLLGGFSFGTPLSPSAQAQVTQSMPYDGGYYHRHRHGAGPVIINNQGPLAVTVGNGNVVQQQSATGPGPVAQQQVATVPGLGVRGGGATNLVTASGNILQQAPASRGP